MVGKLSKIAWVVTLVSNVLIVGFGVVMAYGIMNNSSNDELLIFGIIAMLIIIFLLATKCELHIDKTRHSGKS